MGFITSLCCCTSPGPFDWYGQRRAAFGQNEIPGSDWPDEPNEAEWFYRTPTQWPNGFYSPATPSISHKWYTSQDSDPSWAICYGDASSLIEYLGSINLSIAPYHISEVCYTRRSNARVLTLNDNEVAALSSWTEGAKANYSAGRLEAANTPGTDDTTVEITHSFADTTPDDGYYRVIVDGTADEVTWVLVWIDWGGANADTKLWLNLSTHTFGTISGVYAGEHTPDNTLKGVWFNRDNEFVARVSISSAASPTILVRLVDGDGDEVFNGSNGEGVTDLKCEVRQETCTDPGVEVAGVAVASLSTSWRRITPETPLVDTGTDPEYTDTWLAENESVLVEGREMLRVAHGWGDPFSLIDSRPASVFTPIGFGQMASSCAAANDTQIAFISSDNGEDDGDGACILIYDDSASPEYKVGLGEHVWAYVETGNLPPTVTFPDDYGGAEPQFYEPIGDVNDVILAHPAVWPPRAFPIVIGILIPRSTWFEDSTTNPPVFNPGHSWYVEQEIEEYTAITAGTYAEEWFDFHADDNDLGLGLIPDWLSAGNGIPLIRATKSPIWEDTYSQTRIIHHESSYFAGDEEVGESAISNRALSGACHVWCNMPATTGDSHGDVHGAIFTHGRAEISISGTAPWRSWIEGEDDPVPDVPTESADVTTWLTLAIGSAGTAGTVGDDNVRWEEEIWRDEDRYWIHNLSAVKAMEGTSRKSFVYGEKLYDSDPPDASGAGTVVGVRLHYCDQTGTDHWYIDTERTDLLPDCVASSDRWLYVVDFDADNDLKTSWAMSHEAADPMDPSAGPLYRHFASYDDGVNPIAHDPFPGGSGVGYVDSVKISSQVDQTPEVADYS